jgi:hypothetical protein
MTHHHTKRCRYSKCIGKKGRTIKNRLYSYYKRIARSAKRMMGKKKGG